jgi:hypothetical protein
MPVVDQNTGEPLSDDPDQDDEKLRGGEGRGRNVDAHAGGPGHSSIVTGPNNEREAQPGAVSGDGGNDPAGSNATGGV